MNEMYTKILNAGELRPCPFCGHRADLWEYSPNKETFQKVVMCSNGGDEDEDVEPCPMYMPPEGFYKARKSEAEAIWNHRS